MVPGKLSIAWSLFLAAPLFSTLSLVIVALGFLGVVLRRSPGMPHPVSARSAFPKSTTAEWALRLFAAGHPTGPISGLWRNAKSKRTELCGKLSRHQTVRAARATMRAHIPPNNESRAALLHSLMVLFTKFSYWHGASSLTRTSTHTLSSLSRWQRTHFAVGRQP